MSPPELGWDLVHLLGRHMFSTIVVGILRYFRSWATQRSIVTYDPHSPFVPGIHPFVNAFMYHTFNWVSYPVIFLCAGVQPIKYGCEWAYQSECGFRAAIPLSLCQRCPGKRKGAGRGGGRKKNWKRVNVT